MSDVNDYDDYWRERERRASLELNAGANATLQYQKALERQRSPVLLRSAGLPTNQVNWIEKYAVYYVQRAIATEFDPGDEYDGGHADEPFA